MESIISKIYTFFQTIFGARKSDSITIEHPGYTKWLNKHGQLHREDGPAIDWDDGSEEWRINDILHRLDGPARIWLPEEDEWYVHGRYVKIY